MSGESKNCSKCNGQMEVGFILEQNINTQHPSVWVEGAPEPSTWTLTKTKGKTMRLVVTHRCVGCGYLESYATHEWTGKVDPA